MLTMAPLFCWRMIGITCLQARIVLLRLIATQRSNASSVMSKSSASPPEIDTPTLLCRISILPQRRWASLTIALISASLVTSALKATAVPWSCLIMATVSSALARLWSTHSTLAPSRAKVSAVARPLPMPSPGLWPAPTTMATRSFRRIVFLLCLPPPAPSAGKWGPPPPSDGGGREGVLLEHFLVVRLVVDLHGGEHADDGAVEGDGQHQVDHVLVAEAFLDLGESGVRHAEIAHHLARAPEDRLGQRLELGGLAFGLGEQPLDVLVGDAEFLADLDVMGEFVLRALHPADLQDGELAQARVELALEADEAAHAIEGPCHVGRVDQQFVQVGVALQHVAVLGSDLVGFEIGQAGHTFSSSGARTSRSARL